MKSVKLKKKIEQNRRPTDGSLSAPKPEPIEQLSIDKLFLVGTILAMAHRGSIGLFCFSMFHAALHVSFVPF